MTDKVRCQGQQMRMHMGGGRKSYRVFFSSLTLDVTGALRLGGPVSAIIQCMSYMDLVKQYNRGSRKVKSARSHKIGEYITSVAKTKMDGKRVLGDSGKGVRKRGDSPLSKCQVGR